MFAPHYVSSEQQMMERLRDGFRQGVFALTDVDFSASRQPFPKIKGTLKEKGPATCNGYSIAK